jgi:hypothetical protein
MIRLLAVSADEVLGEWMRQEYLTRAAIKSQVDRAVTDLQTPLDLVTSPNYTDLGQNLIRRRILERTGRSAILGWIDQSDWNKVSLSEDEIDSMRTIDGDDWRRRTGGTFTFSRLIDLLSSEEGRRQLRDAGEEAWVEDIERVVEAIRVSGDSGPLVAVSQGRVLMLIEGYHRLAAVRILQRGGSNIVPSPFYLGGPLPRAS